MKAWEICIRENMGKKYIDKNETIWEVYELITGGIDLKCNNVSIKDIYSLSGIFNIDFKEYKEPFIKMDQGYFYIDNYLGVNNSIYVNNREDNDRLSIGNVYPYTKDNKEEVHKQVQLEVDRLKLKIDMCVFAKCNNKDEIDWHDKEQNKYCLNIDYNGGIAYIDQCWRFRCMNDVYFSSEEIAEKAFEKFKDRIEKLYIDNN